VSVPHAAPEVVVCDTSFVGVAAKRSARPDRFTHWPEPTVARIEAAILAISVITLAEARYGFAKAQWGAPRIEREEQRLAGFLQLPLDMAVVDEWARLKTMSKQNGWNVGDNDLWIAATAGSRQHALVTCDQDQSRISDPGLEVLYLPLTAG
jgi:predicted nucleic acid-binding protein